MAAIITLDELAAHVPDGMRLGVGGVHFARLPSALLQRVLQLGRRDFTFISWGGGLALEWMLAAGAVRELDFCFSSLDVFGLAPQFRRALETCHIEVREWTALAMIQALQASRQNLPDFALQVPAGSDLTSQGDFWREGSSPFTHEPILYAKRLDIDCLLLHAQRADREGNIEIQGARGLDLSLIGAAEKVLVTVEEIVNPGELGAKNSFLLPEGFVTAVAHVPWGAYPTSCLPYYSTDYDCLLSYARDRTPTDDTPASETRTKLSRSARMDLRQLSESMHASRTSASEHPYTIDELMSVCLAREFDNDSVCSVGSVSPLAGVAYSLAKKTHAPRMKIIALNGGFIDVEAHPMSIKFAEPVEFRSARVHWGGDETYNWYYQRGKITHEVITVAQIDVFGRTNNAWIDMPGKRIRLPGQGGMADVANFHQNFTLYLTRHTPERFVHHVEFCTAARALLTDEQRSAAGLKPGKVSLISNLGIFELDHSQRRFRLISIHPGITVEEVTAQTGGPLLIADPLPTTEPPSDHDLRKLRAEIDPLGIGRLEFVSGRERYVLLEEIFAAEQAILETIQAT